MNIERLKEAKVDEIIEAWESDRMIPRPAEIQGKVYYLIIDDDMIENKLALCVDYLMNPEKQDFSNLSLKDENGMPSILPLDREAVLLLQNISHQYGHGLKSKREMLKIYVVMAQDEQQVSQINW